MAADTSTRALDLEIEAKPSAHRAYTPADFLWQFASVIAVCLGLALMAHVLVAIVGPT